MSCLSPRWGWLSAALTSNGKRRVVFNRQEGYSDVHKLVPCGSCIGCMEDKASSWAVRCAHEAQMHDVNCFVTLTYDDVNVPRVGGMLTLRPRDFVLFMKRLRKEERGRRVRFFQAGEYGKLGRPHHHCLLFGMWFEDAVEIRRTKGCRLFRSAKLERLWPFGFSSVGSVTYGSAMYVAQYSLKKLFSVKEDYGPIVPEYVSMSRKPGLGRAWIERYHRDIYPSGECVTPNGKLVRVPRYYDDFAKEVMPDVFSKVYRARADSRSKLADDTRVAYARSETKKAKVRLFRGGVVE